MKDWDLMYRHITKMLRENLPPHLNYHHAEHSMHVLKNAGRIAVFEELDPGILLLLKTAALYHDIGFLKGATGHEAESARIAARELPHFGYSTEEIEMIKGMIMATAIPQKPKTLAEKILADADLEYLGTDDFKKISETLFDELKHDQPLLSRKQWIALQIEFLRSHKYHTEYCIQNRKPKKEANLLQLIKDLSNEPN
jgi:HD superfamily phosphodiesterase